MPFDRLNLGVLQVLALLDGDREIGPIVDSFPDAPAEGLMAYRERYPEVYGEHDGWRLRVRAWLIRHPGGVVLVDAGIGQAGSPGVDWFGAAGRLPDLLHETGTPPDAIDTVVISHVHDDHIGGLVSFETGPDDASKPEPAFHRSRHVIQRADWDWQRQMAKENDDEAGIFSTLLAPLEEAGLVDLIDGDVAITDEVAVHHAPGHTPGHQVVRLRSEGLRAIVSADTFNHPAQLSHPDWPSGLDAFPTQAAATRRALMGEILGHPGTVMAPTHFAESFGAIKTGPDGLAAWIAR